MANPLIVALDVETFDQAKKLVDELGDLVSVYKVGSQMFTAYGPEVVRYLEQKGKKVFLDLKFHDIPNTVAKAVESAVGMSKAVFMLTVHTQGGLEMMTAASQAAAKSAQKFNIPKPLIVGVTVLTSDSKVDNIIQLVLERALLAKQAGLSGVVASPLEAQEIRQKLGKDFVVVTPGIRPKEGAKDDQKRVATPADAIKSGSNFLVVGRPIVQSSSPRESAKEILKEISAAI